MIPTPSGAIKIALIEPEPRHTVWIDELIRLGGVPAARTTPNEADVILLGLETFGCSEMDFVESLHAIFPETPIVILSGTDSRLWTGEAVRLGAQHVLEKDDLTSDKLASAIRFYACYVGERPGEAVAWPKPTGPLSRLSYATP
jgi:DNA-binding NarL/FixJ family response regulator